MVKRVHQQPLLGYPAVSLQRVPEVSTAYERYTTALAQLACAMHNAQCTMHNAWCTMRILWGVLLPVRSLALILLKAAPGLLIDSV